MRILIADDDLDDKEMLIEALHDCMPYFEVKTAENGAECLALISGGPSPDLVFLDINMPLTNGIECLKQIKKDKFIQETPIIIYSTSCNEKDICAAQDYGARFYVVKPFSLHLLQQILKFVLKLLNSPVYQQLKKENFAISATNIHNHLTRLYST